MADSKDWESILSRLTEQKEYDRKPADFMLGFCTLIVINGIFALCLMLLNFFIVKAWPSLLIFSPGIGYALAFCISFLALVLFILLKAISSVMNGSNAHR